MYAVSHATAVMVVLGLVNWIFYNGGETCRGDKWQPDFEDIFEKIKKLGFPIDPDTKKEAVNAKKLEAMLAKEVYDSVGPLVGVAVADDGRQRKVGGALKLIEAHIKRVTRVPKPPKASRSNSGRKKRATRASSAELSGAESSSSLSMLSEDELFVAAMMAEESEDFIDPDAVRRARRPKTISTSRQKANAARKANANGGTRSSDDSKRKCTRSSR